MAEIISYPIIKSQPCHRNNKMYFNLIIINQNEKPLTHKTYNQRTVNNGDKIQFGSPNFERNKQAITRKEIKQSIKQTNDSVIIRQEQTHELQRFVHTFNSSQPLTVPAQLPSKLHLGIYLATNVKIKQSEENQNAFAIGEISDNISTKLNFVLWNLPKNTRQPNDDEITVIDGAGSVVRTKYGPQFEFGIGKLMHLKRNESINHCILEQKRLEFLHPLPIQLTSKEGIKANSLKEFIEKVSGIKNTVHFIGEIKLFCETMDFTGIICYDNDDVERKDPYFNGTGYFKEELDGQAHRFKIKNKVMEEVVFQKSAQESIGYEKNGDLQEEIMDRMEDKWWICEIMYGYSYKKASAKPQQKRRKLNNGNVYCNNGFISIIKMKLAENNNI